MPPSGRSAASLSAERHGSSPSSDRGGDRAALVYSLIGTARLNNIDPQAWLADVLGRIADTPASGVDQLPPWNSTGTTTAEKAA